MNETRDIVVLGHSITNPSGNGHATSHRALRRALRRHGHRVLYLEREATGGDGRDELSATSGSEHSTYRSVDEAREHFSHRVREADLVVLTARVEDERALADWVLSEARGVTAIHDIDAASSAVLLDGGTPPHACAEQASRFDLYLSSSGGAVLETLRTSLRVRRPRAFYGCVDHELYQPLGEAPVIDLGYLGNYFEDRQAAVESFLIEPARSRPRSRFAVAGAGYPPSVAWPRNVDRAVHLAPNLHARFYGLQRFALNLTRPHALTAGWSPSARMFEAAACCVPVITDDWPGLADFFHLGEEMLFARDGRDVLTLLDGLSEKRRQSIARRARARVLAQHTGEQRAIELEAHIASVRRPGRRAPAAAAR